MVRGVTVVRSSWSAIGVIALVAALIAAAGLVAHGGLYQFVGTGPETGYLIHRLTGRMWYVTGATRQPVFVTTGKYDKDFSK
jgi:hypothetical protein